MAINMIVGGSTRPPVLVGDPTEVTKISLKSAKYSNIL